MASLPICLFAAFDGSGGESVGCDKGDGAVRRAGSAAFAAAFGDVDTAVVAAGAFVDVLDCMLPTLLCF